MSRAGTRSSSAQTQQTETPRPSTSRSSYPGVGQGDTAVVTIDVAARWPNQDDHGLWFYSEPGTWRFDVRRDNTGWRIWSVNMPPWCGTYSRCATPPPTPAASPSPTPEDLLAPLRSMLPCAPYDPYRQWHNCPPTS